MIQLRNYQLRGVDAIRNSFRAGNRAPLFVLPTGGGKTVTFAHIASAAAARGKRVWVLVHRVELLRQTSAALHKSGVYHGLINPLFSPDYRANVQVASVQTVVNRLHKLQGELSPDLIIVDEAHHAVAGTWSKIIGTFPDALVLGVTATPIRGDGRGLGKHVGGIFDDLILGPQVHELISMGFLVRPEIYAPSEQLDLTGVRIKGGDYDREELARRIDKPQITGSAVEHYRKLCSGTPAVAFCVSVAHAEHVAAEFRAHGYRAFSVDGSMKDDDRKRLLNGLGNGSVQIITSCDLISEGTDIPAIGCAILLRATQSTGLYIQQVGRALRPCEGKDRAIILDHVGNVLNHGLPEEEREWGLDGEVKRGRGSKKEQPTVRVVQCERCYHVHKPQPICPQCGFMYVQKDETPKQVEGELRRMTESEMDLIRMRKQKRQKVGKAQTLEQLEALAKARGYKPGWAKHVFESRQKKTA